MPETQVMALCLDAPMQAWGASSRFQRRSTLLHPTRSAIIGMFCAAAGAAKGSSLEAGLLTSVFPQIRLTVLELPKNRSLGRLPARRLMDYHTVLNTRRADGTPNKDPVVTRREYLMDARFLVLLEGPPEHLRQLQSWIENPLWGVWFGRKCCLPAAPLFRGLFSSREEALRQLAGSARLHEFTRVEEVDSFEQGTDTLMDDPVSFGREGSSCEGRAFRPRRVRVVPAGSE